jgi:EAL domain
VTALRHSMSMPPPQIRRIRSHGRTIECRAGVGPPPEPPSLSYLSHTLGLTSVAEGVETADTAAALQGFGCDAVQGHYYSRPSPPPNS